MSLRVQNVELENLQVLLKTQPNDKVTCLNLKLWTGD